MTCAGKWNVLTTKKYTKTCMTHSRACILSNCSPRHRTLSYCLVIFFFTKYKNTSNWHLFCVLCWSWSFCHFVLNDHVLFQKTSILKCTFVFVCVCNVNQYSVLFIMNKNNKHSHKNDCVFFFFVLKATHKGLNLVKTKN